MGSGVGIAHASLRGGVNDYEGTYKSKKRLGLAIEAQPEGIINVCALGNVRCIEVFGRKNTIRGRHLFTAEYSRLAEGHIYQLSVRLFQSGH